MPDPGFTKMFREICATEWGIRPSHALAALRSSDQDELVEYEELRLRIAAKRIAPPPHSSWLLVVEKLAPEPHEVEFAVRAFANDDPAFDTLTPLHMLRRVVEVCGARLRIAGVETNFLIQRTIPFPGKENVNLVEFPKDQPDRYGAILRFKYHENPPIVKVALAFGIGVRRYKAYLRGEIR